MVLQAESAYTERQEALAVKMRQAGYEIIAYQGRFGVGPGVIVGTQDDYEAVTYLMAGEYHRDDYAGMSVLYAKA